MRECLIAMDRGEITAAVAARLVAERFPRWAQLPVVPVVLNGWDNTTFQLGESLSVRLPSEDGYVAAVEKEHRWLPVLAPYLPLPIPSPVALGRPNREFPRPWSIYRWIEGEPVSVGRIADLTSFAADLAGFLAALFAVDVDDGPLAGKHSAFRGCPLTTWDESTREVIPLLADDLDVPAVVEVWEAALASSWNRAPVWVHGDVAPSNLLVADGRLCAVIDFGCVAVGDPACDLVMAWTFFVGESAEAFRAGLPFDEATWSRARGWALWKALVTLGYEKSDGSDAAAAARRFGWRHNALEVIDLVLADHRRCRRRAGRSRSAPSQSGSERRWSSAGRSTSTGTTSRTAVWAARSAAVEGTKDFLGKIF